MKRYQLWLLQIGLEEADNHCHESSIHELRTVVDEMKQELREERIARIQQQKQMEAQWKTELKQVTDSFMASNVALEERMKRLRPELQSKFVFVQ